MWVDCVEKDYSGWWRNNDRVMGKSRIEWTEETLKNVSSKNVRGTLRKRPKDTTTSYSQSSENRRPFSLELGWPNLLFFQIEYCIWVSPPRVRAAESPTRNRPWIQEKQEGRCRSRRRILIEESTSTLLTVVFDPVVRRTKNWSSYLLVEEG